MSVVQYWDDMYRNLTAPVAFGTGVSSEVVQVADLLPSVACGIDIGCGDGRNTLFLAERGCKMSAIDISPVGIAKVRQFAAERGLEVDASVQDIRHYTFSTNFHLMVSAGTLHLIEREYWRPFFARIQEHTYPGGYNVIGVMNDLLPAPNDQKDFFIGLFHEGVLFEYYAGWEIIAKRSIQYHDEHPGGIRHHHSADSLLARKPFA